MNHWHNVWLHNGGGQGKSIGVGLVHDVTVWVGMSIKFPAWGPGARDEGPPSPWGGGSRGQVARPPLFPPPLCRWRRRAGASGTPTPPAPPLQVEAARGGKWHAHPSCHLEGWMEAVRACTSEEGKTPLLIADDHTTYIVSWGTRGWGGGGGHGE